MKIILQLLFVCSMHLTLDAQILLRYNLEAGKNYPSVFEVEQSINQTVMGVEQNVDSKQVMEMDMVAERIAAGEIDLAVTYTRVAMVQESPLGEINYDSDTSKAEISSAVSGYAALVDNGFTLSFDETGEITKVSGLDAMVKGMIENMNIEDSVQKAETMKIVKEQFDEKALASQMQNSLAIFPENEVNIGDSWTVDQSITTPFPMNVTSTYLLTDYDDDYAYLSVDSKLQSGENSSMENAEMTMNVAISGEQSGMLKIERKSGMIQESSLKQFASGSIEMTSPQEMTWPIELETNVQVTGKF